MFEFDSHDSIRIEVALALMRAIQYLPQGVALAVIDPTVGTERRAIAARTEWGVLIGPDNGLLAPAVAMVGGADAVVSIENPELRLPTPGATFHGRDLFGPAAAVIASEQASFEDLGPAIDAEGLVPMMLPLVEHEEGAVVGEVLWVDHFGNAQLNITPDDLRLVGVEPGSDTVLKVASAEFAVEWVNAYGDVEPCPFSPFSDTNLNETPFSDALASPLLQAILQSGVVLDETDGRCALWKRREWVEGLLDGAASDD